MPLARHTYLGNHDRVEIGSPETERELEVAPLEEPVPDHLPLQEPALEPEPVTQPA